MTERPVSLTPPPTGYADWLVALKTGIHGAQQREALAVNRAAFPDMKGFSRANLMYMRAFAEAWPDDETVQQAVGQLPWGHNLVLLAKLKSPSRRLAYAQRAVDYSWSRAVLEMQIETGLLEREGKAPTIGLLLCKNRNQVVAEYALGDKMQPMGIAEYKLLESLPVELRTGLPSIEQIERELAALPDDDGGQS